MCDKYTDNLVLEQVSFVEADMFSETIKYLISRMVIGFNET